MGLLNFLFNGERDSGETTGYGDLSQHELDLLNEADWAQRGEPFDTPVHLAAFPDEGAVYVMDSEGDAQIATTFSYADDNPACDYALLTSLNGSWRG